MLIFFSKKMLILFYNLDRDPQTACLLARLLAYVETYVKTYVLTGMVV